MKRKQVKTTRKKDEKEKGEGEEKKEEVAYFLLGTFLHNRTFELMILKVLKFCNLCGLGRFL